MTTIGIVVGSFHKAYTSQMLSAAQEESARHHITVGKVVWVPGSMEKPLAAKRLLLDPLLDGVVILGIIEKGETKHGMVMAQAVIGALIDMQLELMKPIGIGILGPDIHPSQMPSRLVPYAEDAVKALAIMLAE